MTDSKHTPGEWFTHETAVYAKGRKHCVAIMGPIQTVQQPNGVEGVFMSERDANAHLIAAAPALLAACEAALPHHRGGRSEVGRLLRAAITKAKGTR